MSNKKANHEAVEAFKEAAKAGRDQEALARLSDLYKKIDQLNPAQKADIYYHEGRLYAQAAEWEKAEASFQKLYNAGLKRSQFYNRTTSLHNLGYIYARMGRYEESIRHYRRALRIINSFMDNYQGLLAENYLGQGDCFALAGDKSEARMYYELAADFAESVRNREICALVADRMADLD